MRQASCDQNSLRPFAFAKVANANVGDDPADRARRVCCRQY